MNYSRKLWISSGSLNYLHLAQNSHYTLELLCPLGRKAFLAQNWGDCQVTMCVPTFQCHVVFPKLLLPVYAELLGRTVWRKEISNLTVTFSSRCLTFYPHLNIWKTLGNLSWKIKTKFCHQGSWPILLFWEKELRLQAFLIHIWNQVHWLRAFGSAFISSALVNSAGKSVPLSRLVSPFSSFLYKVRDFQQSKWVKNYNPDSV